MNTKQIRQNHLQRTTIAVKQFRKVLSIDLTNEHSLALRYAIMYNFMVCTNNFVEYFTFLMKVDVKQSSSNSFSKICDYCVRNKLIPEQQKVLFMETMSVYSALSLFSYNDVPDEKKLVGMMPLLCTFYEELLVKIVADSQLEQMRTNNRKML